MSLQSELFGGDPELEACLVSDSAHITEGAAGDHVGKIQTALTEIDRLVIRDDELASKTYGPSTADAVLSFKTNRQIINFSYQKTADNIVGKMTIAALDREMFVREHRRTPSLNCGDPIGGGGPSFTQPVVGASTRVSFGIQQVSGFSQGGTTGPQVAPASLDILWQVTSAAASRGASKHLALLVKAISLLKPVGLNIISSVASPPDTPFPNETFVNADVREDAFKVRKASEKARPGSPNVLRIIVCPFEPSAPEFGITEEGTLDGATFKAFILLNVNKFRADNCTAIHEMIHATGLFVHDSDKDLPDSVFSTASNRSVLRTEHAARLSTAFFAK